MTSHHIISKHAGMGFASFVEERLFNVLNMTSTTYSPLKAEESGHLSHSWTSDGRRIPFYNLNNVHQSQIGIDRAVSNAVDMVRIYFNKAHILVPFINKL